ncbi:hypothetical protein ASE66_24455 [Bosea sp. Root483D1]|nr:hypothetical protein ASE66_24455 [Bosea sp. Root483D1]
MRFCSTDKVNDLRLHPVFSSEMECIAARTMFSSARFRWRPRLSAAAGTAPKILREVLYFGELLERRPPTFAGDDFVVAFGIELDVEPLPEPVRTDADCQLVDAVLASGLAHILGRGHQH